MKPRLFLGFFARLALLSLKGFAQEICLNIAAMSPPVWPLLTQPDSKLGRLANFTCVGLARPDSRSLQKSLWEPISAITPWRKQLTRTFHWDS